MTIWRARLMRSPPPMSISKGFFVVFPEGSSSRANLSLRGTFVIISQRQNIGEILKIQEITFPIVLVDLMILKMRITRGANPPIIK